MKCSNAPDDCQYDGDVLHQCSCSAFCACATCPDCTIIEGERLTCRKCRLLEEQWREMSNKI